MLSNFLFSRMKKKKNRKLHTYCPGCGKKLDSDEIDGRIHPVCRSCGFIQYLNPSPGAVVLIERGGSVLLGKRCGNVRSGKWSLPGGYINFDEDFLTAAHREVLEETGLHITILSILSVVTNFISSSLHTLVIVLKGEITGGNEIPGDDLEELMWVKSADQLPEMAFESDRHIIRRHFTDSPFGAPVDSSLKFSPYLHNKK